MSRRWLMVDICSGLGGASEPFVQHPDWDVIRVEISELCSDVPHTWVEDILRPGFIDNLLERLNGRVPDLLWCSPPCREFSLAQNFHGGLIENPSLDLVKQCLAIRDALNPVWWIIENVKGSIKHFRPLMGGPTVILGPYCLYGRFPLFHVNMKGYSKMEKDSWGDDPLRPQKRAYVPFKLGEALRQSIQYQSTLEHYLWFNATRAKGKLSRRKR